MAAYPRARELFAAAEHLFGRVPMTWMAMWSGGFPIDLDRARGNRVVDVDGHEYVDFALGDTGAMAGHSPEATVAAVAQRLGTLGGITTMLPTADAEWVGAELARRFGLPLWSFTLTATDANRWALRLARLATGRPKVLTFAYCYHGSVDEAFAVPGPDGVAVARAGNVGRRCRSSYHPGRGVQRPRRRRGPAAPRRRRRDPHRAGADQHRHRAARAGLPRRAARAGDPYGALLMIDETHTFSAGPGGATRPGGSTPTSS